MTQHTWCSRPAEVSVPVSLRAIMCKTMKRPSRVFDMFILVSAADQLPHEEAERLNDVKLLVQQLYTTLRIEDHQLTKERELIGRLEDLNSQLQPLEKVSCLG